MQEVDDKNRRRDDSDRAREHGLDQQRQDDRGDAALLGEREPDTVRARKRPGDDGGRGDLRDVRRDAQNDRLQRPYPRSCDQAEQHRCHGEGNRGDPVQLRPDIRAEEEPDRGETEHEEPLDGGRRQHQQYRGRDHGEDRPLLAVPAVPGESRGEPPPGHRAGGQEREISEQAGRGPDERGGARDRVHRRRQLDHDRHREDDDHRGDRVVE